jgi:hypothetical protein
MVQTHRQYLAAGLSAETIKEALEKTNSCYAHGDYVAAGVIIKDLLDLQSKIINFDALINIIAVNYIREDEDVAIVNTSIHQEKCNFLKSETEQGRFFFRLPEFVRILNNQPLSNEELENFYQSYISQKSKLIQRWSTLHSEILQKRQQESKQAGETS